LRDMGMLHRNVTVEQADVGGGLGVSLGVILELRKWIIGAAVRRSKRI